MASRSSSCGNNAQVFIGAIKMGYKPEDPDAMRYVTLFTQKSCEEFAANENISGLNKILSDLSFVDYPSVVLAVCICKLSLHNHLTLEALLTLTDKFYNKLSAIRERWTALCESYFGYYRAVAYAFLAKKEALKGILILRTAILDYTNNRPEALTPIHASLLTLCIQARCMKQTLPFIQLDHEYLLGQGIEAKLSKSISTVNCLGPEPIVTYFYYSAVILAAYQRYDDALFALEHLLCMRQIAPNATSVEGYKKAILLGLMLDKRELSFPGCRTIKQLGTHCGPYLALAQQLVCRTHSDNPGAIIEGFQQKHRTLIFHEGNQGLVEALVRHYEESAIKDMAKVFIVIEKFRAQQRCFQADSAVIERLIRKLVSKNELFCRIDDLASTYHFYLTADQQPESSLSAANGAVKSSATGEDITDQIHHLSLTTQMIKSAYDQLRVASCQANWEGATTGGGPPQVGGGTKGKKRVIGARS